MDDNLKRVVAGLRETCLGKSWQDVDAKMREAADIIEQLYKNAEELAGEVFKNELSKARASANYRLARSSASLFGNKPTPLDPMDVITTDDISSIVDQIARDIEARKKDDPDKKI